MTRVLLPVLPLSLLLATAQPAQACINAMNEAAVSDDTKLWLVAAAVSGLFAFLAYRTVRKKAPAPRAKFFLNPAPAKAKHPEPAKAKHPEPAKATHA